MGLIDKVNVEVNGSGDLLSTLSTYTTKILKPNIVDGKNILTQAMINSKDTKYVIKYDYEIEDDIIIPEGCILEFDGGIINGAYTITGNSTCINATFVEIFSKNLIIAGTWKVDEVYPEWFGAKGDGVTDDTIAIKNACTLKGSSKLVFSPKTYIFNVIAGTDYTTQRTAIGRIYQNFVEGNNACLKLGNNNNCDIRAYKGFGKVFYVSDIREFKVRNLTIDFNYDNNPIYHISSRSQMVEENTQQNAFQIRDVHNFIVENCTFIGHSGTNCIDFAMTDAWAKDNIYVKIDGCSFLKCGGISYYDNNGVIETAAHDVSTCALHYRTTNAQYKYRLDFTNNYMEGVGINAFNALECSAHIFNYSGNKTIGFASSVMPCAYNDYTCAYIVNNVFLKAKRPVRLWMIGYEREVDTTPAYKELVVRNNIAEIDIVYHDTIKDYSNITNEHGSVIYGLIDTTAGSRNFGGSFIIDNNIVKYVNIEEAKTLLSGIEIESSTFNIYQPCDSNLSESKCELLQISNNYTINSNAALCRVATFSKIIKFIFDKNTIINPFNLMDKGRSVLYFYLSGNAGVSGYGIGDIYITNTLVDNSEIVYDEGSYAIVSFNLTSSIKENRVKVIIKNRTTKLMPLTNLPGGTFVQQIVDDKNFDNKSVSHNNIPSNLNSNDFGTIIYDTDSDWSNMMFWNGSKFVNGLGQTSALRMGPKAFRDDMASNKLVSTDKGFLFFDTNLNRPVFFNGTKFVNSDSTPADVRYSGTFSQKPSSTDIYIGFQYFCTDTKKTITYGGNNIWHNSDGTIPVEGDVQVFADPECTQYATGVVDKVYVRVNVPWGFDEGWGVQPDFIAGSPSTDYPEDPYAIIVYIDFFSEDFTDPFTAGQVIECSANEYGGPTDVTNFQKVFTRVP